MISRRTVSRQAIRTGSRRVSRDQNGLPSISRAQFATRNGATWDKKGSYCAENGQLHRVVAEPVLGGLTANDAVPQIVVFAEDVGVRVMALVVHHLPLRFIDVEVPRIEVRVVTGVVVEMVVGAVQDVVAEFGNLQQPVERFRTAARRTAPGPPARSSSRRRASIACP